MEIFAQRSNMINIIMSESSAEQPSVIQFDPSYDYKSRCINEIKWGERVDTDKVIMIMNSIVFAIQDEASKMGIWNPEVEGRAARFAIARLEMMFPSYL